MRCKGLVLLALAACGGGGTETLTPDIGGIWQGTVAAVGARAATTFRITLIPGGTAGQTSGAASVTPAGGSATVYSSVTGSVPIGGSSVTITLAQGNTAITFSGTVNGGSMQGTVSGGGFSGDALTLTKQ